MITKHDADIKGFKQNLLDAEEALKIAQKKNDELETQAEELKKQAEQAKVRILCYSASNFKFKSFCFSESLVFAWLHHFRVIFLQCFFFELFQDRLILVREEKHTGLTGCLFYITQESMKYSSLMLTFYVHRYLAQHNQLEPNVILWFKCINFKISSVE